jgi:hypothetical protein
MRKPISHYCKQVEGWDKLPYKMFTQIDPKKFPPEEEEYFVSFMNEKIGMQITAGVFDTHIHVSVCPVESLGNDAEVPEDRALVVIREFFRNLHFVRMVDDPRRPRMKHFFHYFNYPFANN